MSTFRFAIMGAGNIAQNAHLPVYEARNDVELVAVADLNLERAQGAAEKFHIARAYSSVDELLEKEALALIYVLDDMYKNRSYK